MPTLINRSINLDQSKRFVDTIFLTQGEGGATTLNFSLMQNGVAIDLTGCAVNFLAKKPSGATLTNYCPIPNAPLGKVAYVVTTQTAIEAGALTDARLEVLKSGVAWKSFKFPVTVEAVPDYTTAIQSTNEFTTLQSLTPQITASTTAIGTLASLLTTAKTNLVAAVNELFDSITAIKKFKMATFSHPTNDLGAQTITLGFRPRFVKITTRFPGAGNGGYQSEGTSDGTAATCMFAYGTGAIAPSIYMNGRVIVMHSGNEENYATVAFTDTGIVLTWAGADMPAGTFIGTIEARG